MKQMKRALCAIGLVLCLSLASCTPAEKTAAVNDASKFAADLATCVKQHASDTNASVETVATTCGTALIPDILQFIADQIAAAKKGSGPVDSGAD